MTIPTPPGPTPGEALRKGREAIGMTRAALARQLGITYGYLMDMEGGGRPLPDKYLPLLPEELRAGVRDAIIERERAAIREREEKVERLTQQGMED